MIYRIAEDSQGRVTVSEMNPVTRRVERSKRFEGEQAASLMAWLARCLPEQSFVRRKSRAKSSGPGPLFSDTSPQELAGTPPGTTGLRRNVNLVRHRGTVAA